MGVNEPSPSESCWLLVKLHVWHF